MTKVTKAKLFVEAGIKILTHGGTKGLATTPKQRRREALPYFQRASRLLEEVEHGN